MKKFISLFLVCLLLLSLAACGKFDLSREKLATQEEIEAFITSKALDEGADTEKALSFEYEMTAKSEGKSYEGEYDSEITLKSKYFSNKETEKTSWDFKKNAKYREYEAGDSLNGRVKYKESGILIDGVSNDVGSDGIYIDIYMRGRDAEYNGVSEGKINLDYKTDSVYDSKAIEYLRQAANRYQQIITEIALGHLSSYKIFIDGDDITLISSITPRSSEFVSSTTSRHTEIVLLYDGKTLTDLRITIVNSSKTSRSETTHVYTFDTVKEGDIKEPENTEEYKG